MSEIIGILQTVIHEPVRREERIQTKARLAQREDATTVWDHTHPGQTSLRELDDQSLDALRRAHPATYGTAVVGEQERRHLVDVVARQDAIMATHEAELEKRARAERVLETARLALLQEERDKGMTRRDFWSLTGQQLVESCTTMKDDTTRTLAWKQRYMTAAQNELLQRRADGIPESVSPRRFLNRTEPE